MIEVSTRVFVVDAHAHLLGVESTFTAASGALPSPFVVFMPVWTPGSYLVREYARHVEGLEAHAGEARLDVEKVRKNAWSVRHDGAAAVTVRYRVYANDLTVRTNHVDGSHAYWNGAATYLAAEAAPDAGARVTVEVPSAWGVATALDAGEAPRSFVARSFDELCDSPIDCGPHLERTFEAVGKPHRIVAWDTPDAAGVDWDKLARDTRTIVETEARLLEGEDAPSLPYDRYLFLWHVSPRGRGGLEHRSSSTLLARPERFTTRSGWLDTLSLVAHELLHAWNVKRIRPVGLAPYRYEAENHTRLLWWFEGATSYYDWRILRLADLATPAEYLGHLADAASRLADTPGARQHALADASFDAWIKAYRPDENALDSTVSYYLKGEVVCALFDLEIRARTAGQRSLDDVLRHLWRVHGKSETPVPEGALPALFAEATGLTLDDRFAAWVEGTSAPDVGAALAPFGLAFERATRKGAALGVRTSLDHGRAMVDVVLRGSAASRAGIDVHDELIAVAGKRVVTGALDATLESLAPGAQVPVVVARDGRVRTLDATLDPPAAGEGRIVARTDATAAAKQLAEGWLSCAWDQLTASKG